MENEKGSERNSPYTATATAKRFSSTSEYTDLSFVKDACKMKTDSLHSYSVSFFSSHFTRTVEASTPADVTTIARPAAITATAALGTWIFSFLPYIAAEAFLGCYLDGVGAALVRQ
jgi:hypothetical protein